MIMILDVAPIRFVPRADKMRLRTMMCDGTCSRFAWGMSRIRRHGGDIASNILVVRLTTRVLPLIMAGLHCLFRRRNGGGRRAEYGSNCLGRRSRGA